MSSPHRCGHCGRAIIAGDAYQCTRCSSLYHATCWATDPRCSCAATTSRVVHVGPGGRIEVTAPPSRPTPTHRPHSGGYAGQRRPSQAPPPPHSARQYSTEPRADVELECPNCMLPIDSLDEPCPFCNRMPRFGKDVMVIDQDNTPVPWGVQTISVLNKILGVISLMIAGFSLIPLFAEAELAFLFFTMFFGSWGYLSWRLGTDLPKRKNWARTTQTVLSVLALFGFPIGTVVAPFVLWGLHSDQADRFFDERPLLPEK